MAGVYHRLAQHLEHLVMGYPYSEALIDLLQKMFTPLEAEVALAIPNDLAPLEAVDGDLVAQRASLPRHTVLETLEDLASRHLLYSRRLPDGTSRYALLQVGYGIPQTFFWGGQADDRAREMARRVLDYFTVSVTGRIYGGVPTKTYTYRPANLAVNVGMQGVLPYEQMEPVVERAGKIAVAHCPCRMSARILGRHDCHHSLEVCIKYDEMAEFIIDHGLGRPISRDEALHILQECEKEGLVHMVDNAQGKIKHTCNCCGHYCWNVGILRRRKIPRDHLMAVYFIRQTNTQACIGCGACAQICPVEAVTMVEDCAQLDRNWCIGCGVCAVSCPADAISLSRRTDAQCPSDFKELHQRIRVERNALRRRTSTPEPTPGKSRAGNPARAPTS